MIHVERTIRATRSRVWTFLGDVDHWDDHLSTFDDVVRQGEDRPIDVGARFRVKQPGLLAADFVVTEWQPEVVFTWESRLPGLATVAGHRLTDDGGGCRLALTLEWSGFAAPLARFLLRRKAEEYVAREAAELAALAERG